MRIPISVRRPRKRRPCGSNTPPSKTSFISPRIPSFSTTSKPYVITLSFIPSGKYGVGIGVAGSGISGCGPALGLSANITDRASIRTMLDEVALAYGGFDAIEVTAGVFIPVDTTGHIPDDKWAFTFAVNVSGSYFVADEAFKTWKEQGLRGALVLTTSANAVVAKKGSAAYDTSKAAANHLVRELAMELAPLVRVNGVAPATVVAGSSMFVRARVIGALAKYDIPYSDDEADDSLALGRMVPQALDCWDSLFPALAGSVDHWGVWLLPASCASSSSNTKAADKHRSSPKPPAARISEQTFGKRSNQ